MALNTWIDSLRRVLWLPLLVLPLFLLAACNGTETQPETAAPTAADTAPATQPTARCARTDSRSSRRGRPRERPTTASPRDSRRMASPSWAQQMHR